MSEHASPADPKPPSVDRLSLLWQRINEHKIVQWSVAYIALAYAIQHGVTLTSEAFEWPHGIARVTMLLLALGLPLVMTFAWYHGARASAQFTKAELSILSVLLAIGSLLFYQFVQPSEEIGAGPRPAVQEASVPNAASASVGNALSIAVLPFVNLSDDRQQEFFSDGMTEEITSALAKIQNLRVVGRTSAFQFKGENKDLRAIGQALSATHLIEGSVRKEGNEVRITAQLIRADDGTHLWTESYNRELKGVFAIQEEIATAIAASLRVPLGLKEGQSLVSNRTSDTDSYQDYLRARALVRGRGAPEPGGPLTEAAKLLEQATARDPNYAPAWGLLGQAYTLIPVFSGALINGSTDALRGIASESLQKAETAAQRAIQLDPNNIDGYLALALVRNYRGKYVEAEDLYKKALSLDPGNPDALHHYSLIVGTVGRMNDTLAMRRRLQAQEPLVPVYNFTTGAILFDIGQGGEAIDILKASPANYYSRLYLAEAYAWTGRQEEAAGALREIPSGVVRQELLAEAIGLLENAPAPTASPQTNLSKGLLGFVYLYAGAPNRALDFFEGLADIGSPGLGNQAGTVWAPAYAPARKTERFKAYVRKAGMVDYWRARGWPDHCRPMGSDDFVCD